jgi:hypothetical protein
MADQRIETERMEALKLVRCFVTTKEGMQYISDGVMRAVIAIAEQSDEELRNACLETLGEMGKPDNQRPYRPLHVKHTRRYSLTFHYG